MQLSDPLWSVLLQFSMCVLENVVLAKSRAEAGVLCCFHLQLWQRGSSLFAPSSSSFCCVAFYSTTTTGAWPCREKGCVLVSDFLPFSAQYISCIWKITCDAHRQGWKSKCGSQTVRVLQQGPGPLRPELTADWLISTIPGFWLAGPRGVLSPPATTEAQGRCEERGHVVGPSWPKPKLRSSLFSRGRLVCRSGGATHHPFLMLPRKAFL